MLGKGQKNQNFELNLSAIVVDHEKLHKKRKINLSSMLGQICPSECTLGQISSNVLIGVKFFDFRISCVAKTVKF